MRTLQCFETKFEIFFCQQKVEKNTLKSCSEKLKLIFFLTASTAQMAQTEEFIFQNVAYRPTVYRTGMQSSCGHVVKIEFGCNFNFDKQDFTNFSKLTMCRVDS